MSKSWLLFIMLQCCIVGSYAGSPQDTTRLLQNLKSSVTPDTHIKALLALTDYHLEKMPIDKSSYERCGVYAEEALQLSHNNRLVSLEQESLMAMSRRAARLNDTATCVQLAMKVIGHYQKNRNRQAEAETWLRLALALQYPNQSAMFPYSYASYDASHFNIIHNAQQKCIQIALQTGDKQLAARAYMQEANLYLELEQYLKADAEARKALTLLEKNDGVLKKYVPYHLLMITSLGRNKNDSALYYGLEALKNAEETEQQQALSYIYMYLGAVYFATAKMDLSIAAFKKYITLCEKYHKPINPGFFRFFSEALRISGKITEAAEYMKTIDAANPLYTPIEKAQMYVAFGRVCTYTRQVPQAEKYYMAAITEVEKAPVKNRMLIYMNVGEFYYLTKKFDKSRIYLEKALVLADTVKLALNYMNVHKFLFLLDTLDKKYVSAITHATAFIRWKDTVNNNTVRSNSSELQLRYETAKKEKDIQFLTSQVKLRQFEAASRKQDLELLSNQLKLQESETDKKQKDIHIKNQNISLLTKEKSFRQNQLDTISTERKAALSGIALLLVISGLLFYQSRIKQRSNAEITKKNEQLQQLVQEKELLVKEIHHRVKNNLQTVMSLLESQSVYLKDEALLAVHDSQNRIHMMSALHQSLYQGDNISTINMAAYLPLMASYLKDSFNIRDRIHFDFNIDPIDLDVSRAVPVGLIFNEAVTNAIKYAFTETQAQKLITINMQASDDNKATLSIADNGKGMPLGFSMAENKGLGLTLIRSLAEDDMKGKLSITTSDGTAVSVTFITNNL